MATYRLFGDLAGPATAASPAPGGVITSLMFELTAPGWLDGYWLWVCSEGGSTAPQTFALWILDQGGTTSNPYAETGVLVPGTTVTSAELVPGQWNFIPLPRAVPLSIAAFYQLETATLGGFPVTQNRWASGDPWANGVRNGPLYAPPAGPNSTDQGAAAAGSNPTTVLPIYSSGFPFFWLDPQISTEAPVGGSYRLWPGMPVLAQLPKVPGGADNVDTTEQSAGTEFWLSDDYPEYTLDKIWFWSPPSVPAVSFPAAKLLPSSCAIWDIATKEIVPGTLRGSTGPTPATMPDWRTADGSPAVPGDGWVYCAYEGVTLLPGKYKTSVYSYGGGTVLSDDFMFFAETTAYFGPAVDGEGNVTGPAVAPNGILAGPLTSPNVASAAPALSNGTGGVAQGATVTGNSTYQNNDPSNTGTFLYPNTFDSSDDGENRWIDVEVTPVPGLGPGTRGALMINFP